MVSITVNDSKFQARLNELMDVMIASGVQSDPAIILREEARLFLKEAMNFTPPKTRKAGENTIAHDAAVAFRPLSESFLLYEVGGSKTGADFWFTAKGSGAKIHALFNNVDIHGAGMEKYYRGLRGAGGRPPRYSRMTPQGRMEKTWNLDYVVGYPSFAAFVARRLSKVGMRKSGWLSSYIAMGGKVPKWIARHAARKLGNVQDNLSTPGKPSVVMSSHAPGCKDDVRVLKVAMRNRQAKIVIKIKKIVAFASRDLKAGGKIRSHGKEVNGSV